MYVHVIGWETAKKDNIDLEGSKLKEKQGLYTCPPSSSNQLPFHCCLEVKEEQIKVGQYSCHPLLVFPYTSLLPIYIHVLDRHAFTLRPQSRNLEPQCDCAE